MQVEARQALEKFGLPHEDRHIVGVEQWLEFGQPLLEHEDTTRLMTRCKRPGYHLRRFSDVQAASGLAATPQRDIGEIREVAEPVVGEVIDTNDVDECPQGLTDATAIRFLAAIGNISESCGV
ncbi:hypothetical protein GCM10007382_00720 [Salinibacterium xinjiangense]|nr:hypothetical protein GCM10007382_00720 [Salinibacterium xinjiangense]